MPIHSALGGNAMHRNICTHPGIQALRRCAALLLIAGFISITATAQNGRPNSNTAQAVLHIQVNVVPIVMLPMQKKAAESTFITYSLKNEPLNVNVKEATGPLPAGVVTDGNSAKNAVLKTLTVVTK